MKPRDLTILQGEKTGELSLIRPQEGDRPQVFVLEPGAFVPPGNLQLKLDPDRPITASVGKEQSLKLYLWEEGVNCLEFDDPGICFALATSKEEAIDLICKSEEREDREDPLYLAALRRQLQEKPPSVYESGFGYARIG